MNCCGVEAAGDAKVMMKVLLSLHPNKAVRWAVADVEVAIFHSRQKVVETVRQI
jgi:hypothetical protein